MSNYLSIWELGHHIAGIEPDVAEFMPLMPEAASVLRLLMNEIYEGNLISDLIYDEFILPRDGIPDFHIEYHLDKFWSVKTDRHYPIEFLQFHCIEHREFLRWCEKTDRSIEQNWHGLNLELPRSIHYGNYTDSYLKSAEPRPISKREHGRLVKEAVVAIAKRCWAIDPSINLTHMVREPKIKELGKHVREATIRGWLSDHAPEGIKKPGRPRKK